jgi:hypothetical protein
MRRIGVLNPLDENDPEQKRRHSAFTQTLSDLNWTDGRNMRIDLRWGGVDINRIGALAQELVGLQPDIIATNGTPATTAVQRETRTIPIVFAGVADPVASGLVERLDRPSGNVTDLARFTAANVDFPATGNDTGNGQESPPMGPRGSGWAGKGRAKRARLRAPTPLGGASGR